MKKRVIASVILTLLLVLTTGTLVSKGKDKISASDYTSYCEEIGTAYSVCPELIETLIASNYYPEGRVGLMHLDPELQADRMKKLHVTDLNDSESNILVGTDYLLELFEEYEDPFVVVQKFVGIEQYDEAEIWHILDRSYELEKAHGKILN